jgi:hypothetical protein
MSCAQAFLMSDSKRMEGPSDHMTAAAGVCLRGSIHTQLDKLLATASQEL